jgi:branched-chain amino acid transport system substrate-binding protein
MGRRKIGVGALCAILCVLLVAAALAACGSSSTTSSSSPGATKTLNIGVLMPFSGDGALWGKTELASIQVACADLNAAGGIKVGNDTYMFAAKPYDNEWDPSVSATVARKAVADGVRYVFSWSGPEVLAENAAERGTTVLTFVTASDAICQGPKHPYNYNSWFYYPDNLQVLYSYAKKAHPDFKTVVPIITDDAVSIQEAKYLKQIATPIGFNVLDPVKIAGGETDFYPVLTPLVKEGVNIIDIASPGPEDAALIIKQAHELGYKGIFAHADAPDVNDYANIASWPAMEGFVGAPVYTTLPTATGKHWRIAYMNKTQGDKSTGPTADYDSMLLIAAAMKKAGSVDPEAVNRVLPTVTVEGTTGTTRFGGADVLGIAHLLERSIDVVEVQNGKIVSVFNGWPSRMTATPSPSPTQ